MSSSNCGCARLVCLVLFLVSFSIVVFETIASKSTFDFPPCACSTSALTIVLCVFVRLSWFRCDCQSSIVFLATCTSTTLHRANSQFFVFVLLPSYPPLFYPLSRSAAVKLFTTSLSAVLVNENRPRYHHLYLLSLFSFSQ